MEITADIFVVGGSELSAPSDAAVYLIRDGKCSALIDAGSGDGTERILANIKRCGTAPEEISYIFATHCHFDHTGGINALRKATGAKTVAHKNDAGFIRNGDMEITGARAYGGDFRPTPIDIAVESNKQIFPLDRLTVSMYLAAGHTPGSSVFTVVSDKKLVLFGQDIHGPVGSMIPMSNAKLYRESLKFLLSLEADILCEGHFGVFKGKGAVKNFISSFL